MAWPFTALLVWAAAWALDAVLRGAGAPAPVAFALAALLGAAAATRLAAARWRRLIAALGFPLSYAASGAAASLPAALWLLPLAALWLLYPLRSWRDAPLFPTPPGMLDGLAALAPLAPGARVVDAGCGLGDGLRALHRAYPQARLDGWEWSWPLRLACALRCRGWLGGARVPARVERRDIWAADWSRHDLVYLFQRPESMPRAVDKAGRELRPGAWLASLEFEAAALQPDAVHVGAGGRRVWLYRAPFSRRRGAQASSEPRVDGRSALPWDE